ncbi:MAG: glycosyltransferase family 4 protein [Candidatus Levybacteria bacterium]|nr:glycosyltransferase family 4 protein [Candidatus Levybacteria bacterium]
MKILIFNWRDIKNPSSGGAEILTHEMAKRWVRLGHSVTQFSSKFPNCLSEEFVDNVLYIRKGYPDARHIFRSVHFQGFLYYMINFREKFDVVVDEIHGLPFFTPWYVREKKVALICEVADELWGKLYGSFFGAIGRIIEVFYLRIVYRNIQYLTISESSKKDLIRNGVPGKMIKVLPMGVTVPSEIIMRAKERNPTLLYVGRLSKSKGIEDAIFATEILVKELKRIKLFIVGRGDRDYTIYLKNLVRSLGLNQNIHFFGFVNEKIKFELMARCHVLLVPSSKEGFGLIVPEAGFVGTPAIAYKSKGLSEVVKNKKNGIILEKNNPLELGKNIKMLLLDKNLYSNLQKGAYEESKKYNWDNTARAALEILK